MGNTDWLSQQAEREKNARLYDGKRPRSGCLYGVFLAIAWSVGILVALSALASIGGYLLGKYGADDRVLVCAGAITEKDGTPAGPATMYLNLHEYGRIIRLWSEDSGTVQIEIPGDFYSSGQLKPAGTLISITTYDSQPGHYSPLSQSITMRLSEGREFIGQCAERGSN